MKKIFFLALLVFEAIVANGQSLTLIEHAGNLFPNSISFDGNYVAGRIDAAANGVVYTIGHHSFAWTKDDGLIELGDDLVNNRSAGVTAFFVSASGRVIGIAPDSNQVVVSDTPDSPALPIITAAYYDLNEGGDWHILPYLSNVNALRYGFGSYACAVSDDGNIIVGGQTPGGPAQRLVATYWDVSDPDNIVYHTLSTNAAGNSAWIRTISGDGTIMGGVVNEKPTLWINGEKHALVGASDGEVSAISHNGRFAVYQDKSNFRASLYEIETDVLTKFDNNTLIGGAGYSTPLSVSDNGIVVGHSGTDTYLGGDQRRAFIYHKTLGMMPLTEYLTSLHIDTLNVKFLVATGISADGRKICGYGLKGTKTVGFLAEIPELQYDANPVENLYVNSPTYGVIDLTWEAPVVSENSYPPVSYNLYCDSTFVTSFDVSMLSYTINNVQDGSYEYYIKAVYNPNGTPKESVGSKSAYISMGKRDLPFFDDFSDYQPGGAIAEVWRVLEEIPLSTGYWDVSANNMPFRNSWKVYEGGYPHWCAFFTAPSGGDYNEWVATPYLNATGTETLNLSFNIHIPLSNTLNAEYLAIEIYDGAQWVLVDDIPATGQSTNYTTRHYSVDEFAGKDNLRVRFRSHGVGSVYGLYWKIDNVEFADDITRLSFDSPIALSVNRPDNGNAVHLNWADPQGHVMLRYMWDEIPTSFLSNDKTPYIVANMFSAEDLSSYENYQLTSISFYRSTNEGASGLRTPTFKWFVSQGEGRLFDAEVENPQIGWNTIQLELPLDIEKGKPLYYGVEVVDCDPSDTPIGANAYYVNDFEQQGFNKYIVYADGRGNLYSENDGQTWRKVSEDGEDFIYELFCLRAELAKNPDVPASKYIYGYEIVRNGVNLPETQVGWGDLYSLTNYTDMNPLPADEEACYTVKAYYIYQQLSEGTTECLIINGIQLQKDENGGLVYPSVVKSADLVTLQLPNTGAWKQQTVLLLDSSGKTLQKIVAAQPTVSFRLNVEAGVYFLKTEGQEAVKLIVR